MRQRRKNFLPTLLLALLFWLLWGGLVYFLPPNKDIWIIIFFFSLFGAVFLTAALIFNHSGRGLLLAIFVTGFLLFRFFQIGQPLNLILLTLIFIFLGIYSYRR